MRKRTRPHEQGRLLCRQAALVSWWRRTLIDSLFAFRTSVMTRLGRHGLILLLPLLGLPLAAFGQKKQLDHDAYDIWNRIVEREISHDGRWALYALSPEEGDSELRVHSLRGGAFYSAPRGLSAAFTADSRHCGFQHKAAAGFRARGQEREKEAGRDAQGFTRRA